MALNFETLLVFALGAWALWQLRRLLFRSGSKASASHCGGCDQGCKTTTSCASDSQPIRLVPNRLKAQNNSPS